jgi:uncharacterized protein YjbI with pentapeptide repeats
MLPWIWLCRAFSRARPSGFEPETFGSVDRRSTCPALPFASGDSLQSAGFREDTRGHENPRQDAIRSHLVPTHVPTSVGHCSTSIGLARPRLRPLRGSQGLSLPAATHWAVAKERQTTPLAAGRKRELTGAIRDAALTVPVAFAVVPEAEATEWDEATFDAALERVAVEGVVDAQNVRLNSDQLRRLLDAAPKEPGHYPAPDRHLLHDVDFRSATFSGDASFAQTKLTGGANFGGASFRGSADFPGATFSGDAIFSKACFSGDASFYLADFSGAAYFGEATFSGDASFHASFSGDANFGGATFTGDASFARARFTGSADFPRTTFSGGAYFGEATFKSGASYKGATFERARELGPVLVFGTLVLDGVVFARAVRIEVSARSVSLARAVFPAGADLFVRGAAVSLEDADFAGPSMLVARAGPVQREETALRDRRDSDGRPAPRVLSMRRAKVANLTIAGADLRACRFAGAHRLDGLRLERVAFAQPPTGWRLRWRRVWWTRRQTIAEEHHWRCARGYGRGWYEGDVKMETGARPEPEQIAAIYRDLRKGREDNKDEPGAADFYYGEMEMRRHAANARRRFRRIPGIEETVLWLVSGYGLRASRALAALTITVALGAVVLGLFGFDAGKHPDDGTLLFAAESSTSLLRSPDTNNLTAVGHVAQIVLRLAGPLFFGLALLSLRGRVKR